MRQQWPSSPSYFRDKVVTRDHLRARAKDTLGFRYTLILSGAVTEYTVSEFNGVDLEKHVARTYGYPEARLHVTALQDVAKFIVGSVLLPFDNPTQPMRELRVSGDCLTWKALMQLLEEMQGVKYDIKYLDPALAAEKQEAARAAGDSEGELQWSACATMANGYALLPEPSDNHRFKFRAETAKDTLTRMFGVKK
ncbi:NAD(P)-binding protein [Mycena venus]|uniref:NAD(P)-binding protein n=1 Tax=Mycena venus TaxID=2733690 RepID=A0A8H6Z3Q7_9AGAR|nr:NAD(P)-binding protein [Mycena venus]